MSIQTIQLFDMDTGKIIPSAHCYTLKSLSKVMEEYPDEYLKVYQYIYYMTCPNVELNPFFNVADVHKEEAILAQLDASFSTEDDTIREAVSFCHKLYETPTTRAYRGIKQMLDKLAKYMEDSPITHGRDGNLTSLLSAAEKFQKIRESYKGAFKDLQEEQTSHVRGGQDLAYDQK